MRPFRRAINGVLVGTSGQVLHACEVVRLAGADTMSRSWMLGWRALLTGHRAVARAAAAGAMAAMVGERVAVAVRVAAVVCGAEMNLDSEKLQMSMCW